MSGNPPNPQDALTLLKGVSDLGKVFSPDKVAAAAGVKVPSLPTAPIQGKISAAGGIKPEAAAGKGAKFNVTGALEAAGGAYLLNQWASNGFPTDMGSLASAAASTGALIDGLMKLGLTNPWTGLMIAGAVILISMLFPGGKKKDRAENPAEGAQDQFNDQTFKVGYHGTVMAVTAGAFLSLAGVQFSPSMPSEMHDIPVSYVNHTSDEITTAAGGMNLPADAKRYSTVFYDANCGKGGGCLFYLTRGGTDIRGNPIDKMHMLTLKEGMTVVGPVDPSEADIPAFVSNPDGTGVRPNPDAYLGLSNAGALSQIAAAENQTYEQRAQAMAQSGVEGKYAKTE